MGTGSVEEGNDDEPRASERAKQACNFISPASAKRFFPIFYKPILRLLCYTFFAASSFPTDAADGRATWDAGYVDVARS